MKLNLPSVTPTELKKTGKMSQHLNIYIARNSDGYTITTNGCVTGVFTSPEECYAALMPLIETANFDEGTVSINNITANTLEKANILVRSIR